MEFTCTQENLATGIGQVVPVTGRNVQLPILQHALLEVRGGVLHITGTDLEVGVHAIVGGKATKEGSCAVPARQLHEYVQQLPSDHPVEIKQKGKVVAVTTPGFRAAFRVAEVEDFPLLPAIDGEEGVQLNARLFCQGMGDVLFAAAREESRPEIHSVFIQREAGELKLAATDSFRLAERLVSVEEDGASFTLLLPVTTTQEVIRLFTTQEAIRLIPRENLILLRGEGVELSSRLIDATYPDYRQIIPKGWQTHITVDREKLIRALKTLLVFLPRDSRRVRVVYEDKEQALQLGVAGGEAGEGDVTVPAEGEGGRQELLLNIQYVLEGVQHIAGNTCEVAFQGPEAPVVFRPQGGHDYVYVVMPIQA